VTVPIEGTGYDVGIEISDDGVTISADPNGQAPPLPVEIPPVEIPPPPPDEEEAQEFEEGGF
jgi:hypothetical protein